MKPHCPWCLDLGFVCGNGEQHLPWTHERAVVGKPGIPCPRCNPGGSWRRFNDAEMDRWVSRGVLPPAADRSVPGRGVATP